MTDERSGFGFRKPSYAKQHLAKESSQKDSRVQTGKSVQTVAGKDGSVDVSNGDTTAGRGRFGFRRVQKGVSDRVSDSNALRGSRDSLHSNTSDTTSLDGAKTRGSLNRATSFKTTGIAQPQAFKYAKQRPPRSDEDVAPTNLRRSTSTVSAKSRSVYSANNDDATNSNHLAYVRKFSDGQKQQQDKLNANIPSKKVPVQAFASSTSQEHTSRIHSTFSKYKNNRNTPTGKTSDSNDSASRGLSRLAQPLSKSSSDNEKMKLEIETRNKSSMHSRNAAATISSHDSSRSRMSFLKKPFTRKNGGSVFSSQTKKSNSEDSSHSETPSPSDSSENTVAELDAKFSDATFVVAKLDAKTSDTTSSATDYPGSNSSEDCNCDDAATLAPQERTSTLTNLQSLMTDSTDSLSTLRRSESPMQISQSSSEMETSSASGVKQPDYVKQSSLDTDDASASRCFKRVDADHEDSAFKRLSGLHASLSPSLKEKLKRYDIPLGRAPIAQVSDGLDSTSVGSIASDDLMLETDIDFGECEYDDVDSPAGTPRDKTAAGALARQRSRSGSGHSRPGSRSFEHKSGAKIAKPVQRINISGQVRAGFKPDCYNNTTAAAATGTSEQHTQSANHGDVTGSEYKEPSASSTEKSVPEESAQIIHADEVARYAAVVAALCFDFVIEMRDFLLIPVYSTCHFNDLY